jgi:prepilin-type N-terminal cleavage/methylation domain-containing protein
VNERGFTLLEGLLALALLSIALAGILPAFFGYLDVSTRNEIRTGAVAAAQLQMEALRVMDPATMPDSGSTGPAFVGIEDREYELTSRYCIRSEFCSTNSRHVLIEVGFGGNVVYQTESVFTKLR